MNAESLPAQPESQASLVLIIHDAAAQRVLQAWTFYPIKAAKVSDWKHVEPIDFVKLAKMADVPASRCEPIFYRLRMARLVHPDGTISRIADQLIDGQVRAHIRGLIRQVKSNARA